MAKSECIKSLGDGKNQAVFKPDGTWSWRRIPKDSEEDSKTVVCKKPDWLGNRQKPDLEISAMALHKLNNAIQPILTRVSLLSEFEGQESADLMLDVRRLMSDVRRLMEIVKDFHVMEDV